MAELRDIPQVVQNPDCPFSYDIFHWENGIRKTRNNHINIQIACIPYNRVNEFIQAEGNNVLAPTSFYQTKVKNDTDMERARVNKNNFIKYI